MTAVSDARAAIVLRSRSPLAALVLLACGSRNGLDCYAPSFELQVRALIASGLAMTLHTAELRDESTPASPGYVAVDYFEALCE